MAEVLVVDGELIVAALENPGQSFASERKRVRLALLRNYAPFLDELVHLAESVRSYDDGLDRDAHAKFQSDWKVEIEIGPTSHYGSVVKDYIINSLKAGKFFLLAITYADDFLFETAGTGYTIGFQPWLERLTQHFPIRVLGLTQNSKRFIFQYDQPVILEKSTQK